MTDNYNSVSAFLDEHINKPVTDYNSIDVFPLMCGMGKSRYITQLISDRLTGRDNSGLIIVTDSVDRLNNYVAGDMLTEYISRNRERLAILNSGNIREQLQTLHSKPIVLMTTQRYFALTVDAIQQLTSYDYGMRDKIIFDEKPYLFETRRVDIAALNRIDTAIKSALDDTTNQAAKAEMITEWESISGYLQSALQANERENTDYKRERYFLANREITPALKYVEPFYDLVNKDSNIRKINSYNPTVTKDLESVHRIFTEAAIVSQKIKGKSKDNKYDNYYMVVIDNLPKLIGIGAKVYVLDGTADISPEYQIGYCNLVNCSQFRRDLSNLTIKIVDTNTSKTKLTKRESGKHVDAIIDSVKAMPEPYQVAFTYKDISKRFESEFPQVNYFGNIKGRNDYRETKNIVQVGLNRFPDLVYLLYANAISQAKDRYQFDTNNKYCISYDYWHTANCRVLDGETINRIMCNSILADIEQNLLRSKIRNTDNQDKVTYTIYYNSLADDYYYLTNRIIKRYEKLGAMVELVATPKEICSYLINKYQPDKDTRAQKIIDWLYSQPQGATFRTSEMLGAVNLTQKQFDKLKKTNSNIKKIFDSMRTEKKGYYHIR